MGRERTLAPLALLGGFAVGAAAMYFYDRRLGRRRRARLRDRLIHFTRVSERSLQRTTVDVSNRAKGTVARTRRYLLPQPPVEDEILVERVRAALGHLASRPQRIE